MKPANNLLNYVILPFIEKYEGDVKYLMDDIQKEFEAIFTAPGSKSISELVAGGSTFWVALHQDKVIGTIGLHHFDNKTGIIRRLFVGKEYRGKQLNVSNGLLDTALNEATRRGYHGIYLGTMEQFKAAQKFYSKNHFLQIPRTALPSNMNLSVNDKVFYYRKLS